MLPLLFHPAVRDDIARIRLWYAAISPGLRIEFDRCLDAALNQIQRHPKIYAVVEADYRKVSLARFPYQVFYRIGPESLVVFEISHEQAHPETVLERVVTRDVAE